MNHEAITAIVASQGGYGKGVTPNPFASQCKEWQRRHETAAWRKMLTDKITSLFEPRFITPPDTSEFIEALVMMADRRNILELGMCTGFTSLHILRAIIGKPGAFLTSVDFRPAHDQEFFDRFKHNFRFVNNKTPEVLVKFLEDGFGQSPFDMVFVDSDHTLEHCEKELQGLWPITAPGTIFVFHDCPKRHTPKDFDDGVIYSWLNGKVRDGILKGLILPTPEQLDCVDAWGPGYPLDCSPHLGVFMRP